LLREEYLYQPRSSQSESEASSSVKYLKIYI
jgi:hypothetical protein